MHVDLSLSLSIFLGVWAGMQPRFRVDLEKVRFLHLILKMAFTHTEILEREMVETLSKSVRIKNNPI